MNRIPTIASTNQAFSLKSEAWQHVAPASEIELSPPGDEKKGDDIIEHGIELGDSAVDGTPASSLPLFQTWILQFSGIIRPHSAFSAWWVCYIGWRMVMCLSCLLILQQIFFFGRPAVLITWFFAPLLLATIAAAFLWAWLPKTFRRLSLELAANGDERLNLTLDELNAVKKVPINFITGWLLFGVLMAAARAYTTGSMFLALLIFCAECSTTPVLGALLFALALECALAKKEVRLAKRAAETRALNCEGYKRVQASVFQRSCKWKHTLFFLAGIALYCTVGLIMSQAFIYGKTEVFHTGDDDVVSTVEIDIIIGTELIKEAQLLFMMMQFVMEVNKEADTIISTLLVATWGESSSSSEVTRAHLLLLATTDPMQIDGDGSWQELLGTLLSQKPSVGRISFELLGVRITRRIIFGLLISVLIGILNSIKNELL